MRQVEQLLISFLNGPLAASCRTGGTSLHNNIRQHLNSQQFLQAVQYSRQACVDARLPWPRHHEILWVFNMRFAGTASDAHKPHGARASAAMMRIHLKLAAVPFAEFRGACSKSCRLQSWQHGVTGKTLEKSESLSLREGQVGCRFDASKQ